MEKVIIVTDSCAYFDSDEISDLNIHVVPLTIKFGTKKVEDGTEGLIENVFEQQELGVNPPVVEPPTPVAFQRAYTKIYKETDRILSLHVSSKLSKTYQNAHYGAEPLLGRCNIEFMDTTSILLGQGVLVKAAAEAAMEGADIEEIVRIVRGMVPHVYTVMYVDRMDYLERSGLIGQAQYILGSMFGIKPMLFMEDGEIIPMEKVKTEERAIEKLAEFIAEFEDLAQTVIFQQGLELTSSSEKLVYRLGQIFPDEVFPIIQYNPLLASYVGPTALGVGIYDELGRF